MALRQIAQRQNAQNNILVQLRAFGGLGIKICPANTKIPDPFVKMDPGFLFQMMPVTDGFATTKT